MAARSPSQIMRAGRAFDPPHAGVGVQRQNQDIAKIARLFEQADVAGMQQVVAAVGEDDCLALALPERTLLHQVRAAEECSHQ